MRNATRNLAAITLVSLSIASLQAQAASVPWVGTADYTQASTTDGDEDTVGLFDTYDFGTGAAVIDGAATATQGQNLTGAYQSYVTSHELVSQGGGRRRHRTLTPLDQVAVMS